MIVAAWFGVFAQARDTADSAFEDIIVTGVKSGIKRTNATEDMTIIDSLDLKTLNPTRIEEVLKAVPGLSITQFMGGSRISINGFAGSYTRILIDGIPVVDGDAAGGLNLQNIPLGDVERIEILKGSGSALYGSDAVAGVVNIITKKNAGSRTASIQLQQRYSSNIGSSQWEEPGFAVIQPRDDKRSHWGGWLNGSALLSHNNDWFGVRADAGYFLDAGAVDTLESRLFGDRPYFSIPWELRRNFGIEINSDKTPVSSVRGSFKYADNKRVSSASTSQKMTIFTQRFDGTIALEHELDPTLTLGGYVSGQNYHHERVRFNFDTKKEQEKETTGFPTVGAEVKATKNIGNSQAITLGLAGGYEAVEAVYIKDGGKSATHLAPFVQNIINIGGNDRFIFTPGLRYSWNSRYAGALTPDLGVRVNISPKLFVRAKAGGAYRAPTFKDNYRDDWVHTGGIFVLSGSTDLKPERSWGINGGIGGKTGDLFSWEFGGHATKLYDQITTQEISRDTGTTALGIHYDAVRAYVNKDSAITQGIDVSFQFEVHKSLQFKTTYSVLQSKNWDEDGTLVDAELYSPFTAKASVFYSPLLFSTYKPSFSADIVWRSAQKYTSEPDSVLADIADINAAIEFPFPSLGSMTVGGKNLLDNDSQEWNQATGRTIFAELKVSIYDITDPFNNNNP